jgi:hypothetical protein
MLLIAQPGRRLLRILLAALLLACTGVGARAYSVLTHEQIVDMAWADYIQPLLLARFPGATAEQLREAHAHAYGGCLIQDMGYYPFGNKDFSNLTHYVRSGDFVLGLLREARDLNEYAFALGALAHYASDISGHPAVNLAVGQEFPKLRAKYGPQVTYEDDPKAHIRTEFGFDMVQVAKNRYTSDAYRNFIGFKVAQPLLERAFRATYGIELTDIFNNEDRTIGSYRRAISKIVPKMTKAALTTRRAEIVKEYPTFARKKFLYHLSRAEYEREWGKNYERPGFGTRLLGLLLRIVPKVGPFKALAFKNPSPATEDLYLKSVDSSVERYENLLRQVKTGTVELPNRDFDTAQPVRPGEYRLADQAYATLLHKLAKRDFDLLTPALRANILQFYADLNRPIVTREHSDQWRELMSNLEKLKATAPAAPAAPSE